MSRYQFTSESVTEGHPDKICDAISDAILDGILAQDLRARVACESLAKTGMVVVAGEVTTTAWVDIPTLVRATVREIGYTDSSMGFDANTCAVLTAIEKQSPDISQGVTEGEGLHKEQGAGDQGLMFGYATDETPNLMPAPIDSAHPLARRLAQVRKENKVDFLRPDGKTQVTLEYDNDVPVRVDAIVVSSQHNETVKYKTLREALVELVIEKVIPKRMIDKDTKFHINPTGRFVVGGPMGDCGLTGRKIIVDSYGGMGRHGGGAFSGKDPSKVDRSACYYARYVAKNIVASGVARRCEIQIAYAIGVARPVGVQVNTFGTGKVSDDKLEKYILDKFDMRPKALIDELGLLAPIYKPTAAYGHFGRSEFSWEKTVRAAQIADDLMGGVVDIKGKREHAHHVGAELNGFAHTNGTNGVSGKHKDGKGKAAAKAGKKDKAKKKAKGLAAEA
jgi:S-adenosylmethionine synthetase